MSKRILSVVLSVCLMLALVGCGGTTNSQSTGPKDYTAILSAARDAETNESAPIFHFKDEADPEWSAQGGFAATLTGDDLENLAESSMMALGLDEDDVAEAAFSVSLMNVQAYGVAIVKPAEGKTDAVKEGLTSFIEGQKAAQKDYLADQYEIAKAAKLEVMKSGEVVLVMSEGQNELLKAIKTALN